MRSIAVPFLLLAVVLAGCAAEKADPKDEPTNTTSETTTTSDAPTPLNRAPTAAALANATLADPLNVTFHLNATDADDDNLAWQIDFGDNQTLNGTMTRHNSTELSPAPQVANVSHLYASGGTYNVTVTISDGLNATVLRLNVSLEAAVPFEQFVAAGTPDFACPQCSLAGANTGAGYRSGTNELDSWFVTLPAAAAGQPFVLTSESGDPDMVFRTSCESSGTAVGETLVNDGPEEGIVPEGALCLLAWNPTDVMAQISLVIG